MPLCNVCNKENTSEDLSTIGNQYVCCLSCVGLLKANEKDACTNCGRPVWKDNYYEITNLYFCSEKCKNIIQKKLIKEKGGKYVKCRHFKEEKYISNSPKNKSNDKNSNSSLIDDSFKISINNVKEDDKQPNFNNQELEPFETDKNINDIIGDSDWNKNSFIQKEQEQDISIENINHKENMKILYRIEKSIHSKQIYQSESPFNYKKKENINFIKNIRKYFIEDKDNHHNHHHNFKYKKNNQKSRKRINDNNYNLLTKKSEYQKNHIITSTNFPIHSNFLSSNTISLVNDIEIIKEKHFVKDNDNDLNEKNRSNSLSDVRRLNTIDNKSYYFNPVRKTENMNMTKKDSFPLDSFSYPVDSLPRKTEKDRNSSINCCAHCRRPIILRNSNVHKDFCSSNCRNLYFKS